MILGILENEYVDVINVKGLFALEVLELLITDIKDGRRVLFAWQVKTN